LRILGTYGQNLLYLLYTTPGVLIRSSLCFLAQNPESLPLSKYSKDAINVEYKQEPPADPRIFVIYGSKKNITHLSGSGEPCGSISPSTMSDEYLEKNPVKELHQVQYGDDDVEGPNELHRGLKNRHAQMISCALFSPCFLRGNDKVFKELVVSSVLVSFLEPQGNFSFCDTRLS
jgi:hypothetical protein